MALNVKSEFIEKDKIVPGIIKHLHSITEELYINTCTLLSKVAYVSRIDTTSATPDDSSREVSEVPLGDELLKIIHLLHKSNNLIKLQLDNLEI